MSAWQTLGAGGRAIIVVLGAVGLAAVGYVGWQVGTRTTLAPATEAPLPAVPATAALAPEAAPPEAQQPDTPTATAPLPPTFDNWRVASDGAAVVSGRGAPGASVEVMLDGVPLGKAEVTPSGEFAALFSIPPTAKPSMMSLTMTFPDGEKLASDQTVALGPVTGPAPTEPPAAPAETTADAAPETPPAATAETAAETPAEPPAAAEPETVAAAEPLPEAILLTDKGAVLLQDDAAPALPTSVMIDAISYTPDGLVQLGGRGTPGAFVRVYLDNAPVQTILVPEGGRWLTTLADTPPGIYTLRVDQIDDAGKVTSRFETPFKRETLDALAAAAGSPAPLPATPEPTTPEPTTPEPTTSEPTPLAPSQAEPPLAELAPPEAPSDLAPAGPASTETASVTITVQPGFTLWGIAKERFGEGVMYVQVFDANRDKIKDPDLIYPGQVFALPGTDGG